MIDPFTGVIDQWLRTDIRLRASVIHERLVKEYGFAGSYQRVKVYAAQARPRIAAELRKRFMRVISSLTCAGTMPARETWQPLKVALYRARAVCGR